MKATDLRQLSAEELVAKRQELRRDVFRAPVSHSTPHLQNTARLRLLRRDPPPRRTAVARQHGGAEV